MDTDVSACGRADEGLGFLLRYENIAWYENGEVRILDRRVYPMRQEYVVCRSCADVAQAIADMVTQSGGPPRALAMGMVMSAREAKSLPPEKREEYLRRDAYIMAHARPTTARRMEAVAEGCINAVMSASGCGKDPESAAFEYALVMFNSAVEKYDRIAEALFEFVPDGACIMTQCYAETVLGTFMRCCRKRGKKVRFICPETRPYLQGARLTASLAADMGFPVSVITDGAAAYVMQRENVSLLMSAADIITLDGHVVNKTGTLQLALAARYNGIPYYVTGMPDPAHPDMTGVQMEYRDPSLVTDIFGTHVTAPGVGAIYPSFDVTPPELVTRIFTEKGAFLPGEAPASFEAI